jgi:hypothetical protein
VLIKLKQLSDAGWKDVATKNKVKDNGLLKLLGDLKKVGDDQHDEALKALDEVLKLAAQLKKDKSVAAAPAVVKYIGEMAGAAESMAREVGKAKAEQQKAVKLRAEAEQKAAAKKEEDDDDDEEESPELLTTKLKPLLRLVAKGETMHTLMAKSGKRVVVMLSRKPIAPTRRKMLAEQLGGGSTKYYPGHCSLEAGATTFVLKAEVAGMSKLIKAALLEQTGLRLNKVKCRGEDGDDDDEDEGGDPVAAAPSPPQARADGPALAGLGKSRLEWGQARAHAVGELTRLKQILQNDYRDATDEQAALAAALQRVDATIAAIDEELTNRLDRVINAPAAQRAEVAAAARTAVMRIENLLGSDRILQSIDGNELAPEMMVAEPLRARLKEIAASLS